MKNLILALIALVVGVSSSEKLNFIENITQGMSQFLGEQLNFEYWDGYIPVGEKGQENTSLFFSLTTKVGETLAETSPETPVVFWFNGGPGCSSDFGNWVEIGPIQVDEKLNPSLRKWSWNKQALLIFVDQPLNTGFSYSEDKDVKVSSTVEATQYFKKFITNLYDSKELKNLKTNPTYFFGESYAGHYIPDFAQMLLKDEPVKDFNFKGVGIGDGWTNPEKQLGSFSDFFFQAGVVSQGQREGILKTQNEGIADILVGNYAAATKKMDEITDDTAQYGNIDQYNFFHYNVNGQEDPDTQQYFVNLYQNSVFLEMYGIPTFIPPFQNCNNTIYEDFADDFTRSYQPQVEYLLNQGLKVLLFNGQLDIIVNGAGAQDWINTMKWDRIQRWQNTRKQVWFLPGQSEAVIGNYQHHQNFVYANIYLAGHMVPSDQPEAAYIMLDNMLLWEW